jgi:hypothetical protein
MAAVARLQRLESTETVCGQLAAGRPDRGPARASRHRHAGDGCGSFSS